MTVGKAARFGAASEAGVAGDESSCRSHFRRQNALAFRRRQHSGWHQRIFCIHRRETEPFWPRGCWSTINAASRARGSSHLCWMAGQRTFFDALTFVFPDDTRSRLILHSLLLHLHVNLSAAHFAVPVSRATMTLSTRFPRPSQSQLIPSDLFDDNLHRNVHTPAIFRS